MTKFKAKKKAVVDNSFTRLDMRISTQLKKKAAIAAAREEKSLSDWIRGVMEAAL